MAGMRHAFAAFVQYPSLIKLPTLPRYEGLWEERLPVFHCSFNTALCSCKCASHVDDATLISNAMLALFSGALWHRMAQPPHLLRAAVLPACAFVRGACVFFSAAMP